MRDIAVATRISPAALKELEKIAEQTRRSKADLIRDAILAYIGMYRGARKTG